MLCWPVYGGAGDGKCVFCSFEQELCAEAAAHVRHVHTGDVYDLTDNQAVCIGKHSSHNCAPITAEPSGTGQSVVQ